MVLCTTTIQDSPGHFRNWPTVFSVQGKAHSAQESICNLCYVHPFRLSVPAYKKRNVESWQPYMVLLSLVAENSDALYATVNYKILPIIV